MSIYTKIAYGADKEKYGGSGVRGFYNRPDSYKDYAKKIEKGEAGYTLKDGYIASATPLHSGYGPALYSQAATGDKYGRTGKNSYGYKKGTGTAGLYIYTDPEAAREKEAEEYQASLQSTVDKAAKSNADQLKIIQNEKSAVSKMLREYSAQLKAYADRKVKEQETARISAATAAANKARQGQTSNLQIQPASQTPTTTGGTRAFKRTGISPAGAFTTGISGRVNI